MLADSLAYRLIRIGWNSARTLSPIILNIYQRLFAIQLIHRSGKKKHSKFIYAGHILEIIAAQALSIL